MTTITTSEGKTYTSIHDFLVDNEDAVLEAIASADREAMEHTSCKVQLYLLEDGTFYTTYAVGNSWEEGGDIVALLREFDYENFDALGEYWCTDDRGEAEAIIAEHGSDADRKAFAAWLASDEAEGAVGWDKTNWVKENCPDAVEAATAEALEYFAGESADQYRATFDAIVERYED